MASVPPLRQKVERRTYPSNVPLIVWSAVKVVPKGLRPFGASDSDFFLDLLPGPRNQSGLPESISYWKDRIEEVDPDKTFRVGVIYGPSGCGKTSLVKAGLVPNLPDDILVVDVEATSDETESLLLKNLGKKCPGVAGAGLSQALSVVSEGPGLPEGKTKVLLIIDQFEQRLHSHPSGEFGELATSLKHCDGGRVQAVLIVRDDFWMALTRFMSEVEVSIRQDLNCTAIDLFGERHAKEVLKLFGQAYGTLPADAEKMTNDQREFMDGAVRDLVREEKDERVAPVRLALFAQMLSEREWSPSTLQKVGGAKGVGVEFLKETFDYEGGRRRYQLSARDVRSCESVLGALLPEIGSDIRGGLKPISVLRQKSGHPECPSDFDRLLRILDSETRLITPTEGAGADSEPPEERSVAEGYVPTDPRLPRAFYPGMAHPQTKGKPVVGERNCGWRNSRRSGTPSRKTATCRPPWNRRTFAS